MYFIQILLQTSSNYWNDVIQNAIGGSVGSIIAIAVSFLIYWLTIRETNASAIKTKKDRESNQLKAFAVMLQDAIKMTKSQSAAISEFIEKIKKHPNEFPVPIIYPLGNLKRIIDTITIERTGITYMKYFSGKGSAKEFTSILEIIDYLYAEFQGMVGLTQRASLNHYDRKLAVSRAFDDSNKLVIDYIERMSEADVFSQKIRQIKINFDTNRGSVDNIDSVNTLFFLPLNNFIKRLLSNGTKTNYILDLFYITSRGIEYFEYIASGYKKFENEMIGIESEVKENLRKLESVSLKILNSIYGTKGSP